jgi:outer membrane lipoprotein SlyB
MDDTLSQITPDCPCISPFPNTRPIASNRTPKRVEVSKKLSLSILSLGSEVRLKLRRLSNLGALAVASVGGSLAAGAGVAGGRLVVFVAGAAAGALAGGTLV